MAATLVGIYHGICGKESYLNSVNIPQAMAVAICNSFKHACLQRESLFSDWVSKSAIYVALSSTRDMRVSYRTWNLSNFVKSL